MLQTAPPKEMLTHSHCQLHQCQLAEVLLLATADQKLLSRLYSLANFLRNTGGFVKMLAGLHNLIDQQLQVVRGSPTGVRDADYATEVVGYMADHFQQFVRGETGQGERSAQQYKDALARFQSIFNGAWTRRKVLEHRCMGQHCCTSLDHTKSKMLESLRAVVFRCSLSPPAANKWTKLGPVRQGGPKNQLCTGSDQIF